MSQFAKYKKSKSKNTTGDLKITGRKGNKVIELVASNSQHDRHSSQEWLIIVESPSKCTKIEHLLGDKYKCIASKGHLRTIDGLKSIDSKNKYAIKFSTIKGKEAHIETMRKIICQFPEDRILLGTDDDREGEAIAWHICDIFGLDINKTHRIIFHEITKSALEKAVMITDTPPDLRNLVNMDIVRAQWARQVLDILIGYKISPLLWKYIHNHKSDCLSAGRCQTPALRLVYDNELERLSGVGFTQSYKIVGKFSSKNLDFVLDGQDFETAELAVNFLQKNIGFKHELSLGSPRHSTNSPPKPFNTSCLLQACNNLLRLSPTDTMSICQELYQNGFITYMRTENRKYSAPFLQTARNYIAASYGDSYIGNTALIENKDSSNPHEAIRVTNIDLKEVYENKGKKAAVYRLIRKNTIQSCMAESKQELIDVLITAPPDEFSSNRYKHTIEIPIFLGWKKCMAEDGMVSDQNKGAGLLLFIKALMKSNTPIIFQKIDALCVFHNKHSHYTESSLIKKLEEYGIGRPSTFAMFIETIQERGYVLKQDIIGETRNCTEYVLKDGSIFENKKEITIGNEKNKLVIQPIGIIVIEFLIKYFDLVFSYNYTKNLEDKLDLICGGCILVEDEAKQNKISDVEWYSICDECIKIIKSCSKPITDILKNKYIIDKEHSIVFSKNGPVIRRDVAGEQSQEADLYKSIRKDLVLDIDILKNGGYKIEDLEATVEKTRLLGKWEGEDIYLKHGRFGFFLEWGSQKKACNISGNLIPETITVKDVPELLKSKIKDNKNVLRLLNENLSIRRGKFGAYIYYKTDSMKTPQFFSLKKFPHGFSTCEIETLLEWIQTTYSVA